MKKRLTILFLVFVLLVGSLVGLNCKTRIADAASDINFGGYYLMVQKYDGYSEYFSVDLSQYSTSKGKKKGKFTLVQKSDYRENCSVEGELTRIRKNVYRFKKKNVTITFKVYKKKLVIKQKGTNWDWGITYDFSGTYKKKKTYKI